MFGLIKRIFSKPDTPAAFSGEQVAVIVEGALEASGEDSKRDNRLVALDKALTLHFSETGPTTDDPAKVVRSAATFERYIATGEALGGVIVNLDEGDG